jgi:hypothetical protein
MVGINQKCLKVFYPDSFTPLSVNSFEVPGPGNLSIKRLCNIYKSLDFTHLGLLKIYSSELTASSIFFLLLVAKKP